MASREPDGACTYHAHGCSDRQTLGTHRGGRDRPANPAQAYRHMVQSPPRRAEVIARPFLVFWHQSYPTLVNKVIYPCSARLSTTMAAATVQSSTNLFRQLAWNASVPIEVRLADGEAPGAAVDKYYVS